MYAVTIAAQPHRSLALSELPEPAPIPGFVRVHVGAISLNHGEVHSALHDDEPGSIPGHDFAGTVVSAPPETGFSAGQRVAGLLPSGAWAEIIHVPPFMLQAIPDGVSLEHAAALPIAGMSARVALDKGGELKGKRVLVTGATGGVGLMAVQLAALDGAHVTALVRNAAHKALLTRLGASHVALSSEEVATLARFDVVIDNVGGDVLGHVLMRLASGGVCVLVGNAGGDVTRFDATRFRLADGGTFGGTTLYGFFLGHELQTVMPGPVLANLLHLVAEGRLDPVIGAQAPWSEIDTVARRLLARDFIGKSVLTLYG